MIFPVLAKTNAENEDADANSANAQPTSGTFFLRTKDISGGGMKLISKTPFMQNSILELTFEIPGHGEVIINAKLCGFTNRKTMLIFI